MSVESASEVSQIDRFSQLPPELLEYIFELAAEHYELALISPSKYSLPCLERELYRHLIIGQAQGLAQLAATLETRPDKGRYTKKITWRNAFHRSPVDKAHLRFVLERLPRVVEMEFGPGSSSIARLLSSEPSLQGTVTSLKSASFVGCAFDKHAAHWLSRNPKLRQAEISHVVDEVEGDFRSVALTQVEEVIINAPQWTIEQGIGTLEKLRRVFPFAAIKSVQIENVEPLGLLFIPSLLQTLPTTLQRLHLRDSTNQEVRSADLVQRFPFLRHLHLDSSFFTASRLYPTLLDCSYLISLSLSFKKNPVEPENFLLTLQSLTNLRFLTLEYLPLEQGPRLNIPGGLNARKGGSLGLEGVNILSQMGGWKLPFGPESPSIMLEVEEMERKIRGIGIAVSSNLLEVRQTLHRYVVELANRGIRHLFNYRSVDVLVIAHNIALSCGFQLPSVLFDLHNLQLLVKIKRQLEWFKVDMFNVIGGGGNACIGLGLRYKAIVPMELDEKSDETWEEILEETVMMRE
ncbi:hypothetical protein JCM5350_003904 [Sporobolomyces pararoseus]